MAIEVLVPPLGQTVDSVTLVAWHKNEGESVQKGEMLFAIETDKATLDIEAPATGVLREVTASPGNEVQVLSTIALIAAPGEEIEGKQAPEGKDPADASTARRPPGSSKGQPRTAGQRVFISPRARRLVEEHEIPLTVLKATGPEGAIVERDVRSYLFARVEPRISPVARRVAQDAQVDWRQIAGSGQAGRIMRRDVDTHLEQTRPDEGEVLESIPIAGVRAVIADRMVHSSVTTAAVTLNAEADATELVELRRKLAGDGVEVSHNALLLRILARALRDHPRLNASLQDDTIKVWRNLHVGLAVDSDRGLLVPVVRNVEAKELTQLEAEIRSLVERARTGQSSPEELSGGTFTLTNLGMFGIDSFTPIINPPECAILGVGRIKRRPTFVGDQSVARHLMWLSLSFDHRLVDGGPAARFVQRLVQLIEHPHLLHA